MARLRVVALDARLPGWAERACAEYAKRMPRGYEVERLSVKADRLSLPRMIALIIATESAPGFFPDRSIQTYLLLINIHSRKKADPL